jgi:uncharacterized membrane protein YeiB
MGFLILIGLLHAHFLWSGDILFGYGVCGSICCPLRGLNPVRLLASGTCFLFIGSIVSWSLWGSPDGLLAYLYRVIQECLYIPEANFQTHEMLIYRALD